MCNAKDLNTTIWHLDVIEADHLFYIRWYAIVYSVAADHVAANAPHTSLV